MNENELNKIACSKKILEIHETTSLCWGFYYVNDNAKVDQMCSN